MKNFCRRFFASLLAGILGLLLLGAAAPAASGLETGNGASRERILKIHKCVPAGETGKESAAGTYEIYFVAELEDVLFGQVALSRTPSVREITRYRTSKNRAAAVKTDAYGVAVWNVSAEGFGDGVYLVAETGSADNADPFYVCVPCADPGGEGWLYTVDVYPRVSVPGPEVEQDILTAGNDAGTFRAGDEIVFRIRGGVPGDLYTAAESGAVYAQCYRLADVLDRGLDYLGSAGLCLLDRTGAEISLTAGIHYALAEIPAKEGRGARVAVSLTEAGMRFIAEHLGSGSGTPELRLSYRAVVNGSAAGVIHGNARLEYTDASGYEYPAARVSGESRSGVRIAESQKK